VLADRCSGDQALYAALRVTQTKTPVPAVVCVHAKNMKEPWCLATSRDDLNASEVVALYTQKFTIEENFRDTKDPGFGVGLSATHVGRTDRRCRLLLVGALAQALLTLLGAAAEEVGLDRKLKANTVELRTTALFNQGCYWYGAIPNMREHWLRPLMGHEVGQITRPRNPTHPLQKKKGSGFSATFLVARPA